MRGKLAGVLLASAALIVAAVPVMAQEAAQTAISDIHQESTGNATRLVVECSGPVTYTYYSPDPLTLVVDMPDVDASRMPARIAVGTPEVESVRVTSMARGDGRSLARIEVRLASLVPFQIYSKDTRLNMVFERPAATASAATSKAAPAAPAASADKPPVSAAPAAAAPPVAEPPASDAAAAHTEAPAAAPVAAAEPPKPAPVEEAAPEPPAVPATPATRIVGVARSDVAGQLAFTVKADGRLEYQDFFLGNPDRLVVDFPGVNAPPSLHSVDVGVAPVERLRMAQFSVASPKVARLVLDLSKRADYRMVEGKDGLRIVFGEGRPAAPQPLAALRDPDPAPEPAGAPALTLPRPAAPAPAPAPAPEPVPILPDPQQATAQPAAGLLEQTGKKYTGAPITLDFKDGDLVDIFRLFADISGLNIVINPGVSGKVSLKLTEVPWDQALDLILKTNGLGKTVENNVVRIAKLSDLQKEEQEQRKLQEEKALAGDLHTWRKTLSYAKAAKLAPTVQKVALSARGLITLDERTNTMIITDLQANLDKARDLIADLDRATPQVEIEARIVVTTRNFTRDLGIQWGFNNEQSARLGNATNRSFPNALVLNGSGVIGKGGLAADQGGQASDAGIGLAGRGYAVNLPASGFNNALGISMGNILGSFSLDAAITALERQGRGRILSTPKVTTQNNQEAEIKQGVQIPIQTVANNTVTVTFKDAVLTLKVTPQITDAGTVLLAVEVENNSPDFANLVNGIPPITTQSAKTNVLVVDGSTAVIGGIYQSQEQATENRTPFFGKLPLLGYLFRNRFHTTQNNELLIFITPRIVKG